jgi:lysyl oxidase
MRALRITAVALAAVPALAAGAQAKKDPNPCLIPDQAAQLRCPDLVMKPPYGLYLDTFTRPGRALLRAGNSIDSIGQGPAELHGARIGNTYFMRARQRIYRKGGGRIGLNTGARLYFKFAHEQRRWWKFLHAAEFQIWRVNGQGERLRLVRRGPKVSYCLRDLGHTRPGRRGSPRRRVYPACSTNRRARRVTLGTSIGWSDIYPASYPEQWIDVTGLRGCFAYRHIADPRNGIYESNEDNNTAQLIVRLPLRRGQSRRAGCRGPDVGAGPPRDRDDGEY